MPDVMDLLKNLVKANYDRLVEGSEPGGTYWEHLGLEHSDKSDCYLCEAMEAGRKFLDAQEAP